ncbi:RHS repeat-associated core domain-containing protein [Cysteiniphilum sp. QT6929]|uniref:RHS repeat-associated core domain-containing protein n=1 Tax=Cysteiniphilum sp. QT6929 TaxID=2975055 RepID=UPI0024B32D78|nr:RHS repeat-associated core domain-containing protein [Cysteiniphilum sp. QT6929]WHN66538.1 RHS repeat-associated core domain-containing protein [Cysteiniphilum sp. QT6929]
MSPNYFRLLCSLSYMIIPIMSLGMTTEVNYRYDRSNPAKLVAYQQNALGKSSLKIDFNYDALGNLTNDELGNQLRYNGLGQIVGFEFARGSVLSHYRYNGLTQQYQQQIYKDQQIDTVQLYYNSGQLYNELSADGVKSYYYGEGLEAVLDDEGLLSYVSDQSHNVLMLAKVNNGKIVLSHNYVYSSYGISYDLNESSQQVKLLTDNAIGFNGERTDRVSGYQHLGQGTRAYNPILHRFMQMDGVGYSPFGQGGLNGYAYGLNNPVMNFDPSGHFSFPSWLNYTLAGVGIAGALFSGGASLSLTGSAFAAAEFSAFLGLASGVSDIAVEATHGNNQTLNKVAFGLGVASIAFDLYGGKRFLKMGAKSASNRNKRAFSNLSNDEHNLQIAIQQMQNDIAANRSGGNPLPPFGATDLLVTQMQHIEVKLDEYIQTKRRQGQIIGNFRQSQPTQPEVVDTLIANHKSNLENLYDQIVQNVYHARNASSKAIMEIENVKSVDATRLKNLALTHQFALNDYLAVNSEIAMSGLSAEKLSQLQTHANDLVEISKKMIEPFKTRPNFYTLLANYE